MWLDQRKTATQYTTRNNPENTVEEQLVNYFCLLEFCFNLASHSSTLSSHVLLLNSANFTLLLTCYKVSITIKELMLRHLTTVTTA